MKTTLLLLTFIVCSICKGQDVKVYPVQRTNPPGYVDTIVAPPIIVYDTIKVQLLVSSNDPSNNKVVKIVGYDVRENIPAFQDNIWPGSPTFQPSYNHIQYLDIIKQPLESSIVVWMTKELK